MDVVRYREVANTFGEGAVVVAGLPLPATGTSALAIDAARRLYVALPSSADSARVERYAGMVLRFESDGRSVPSDGADAPVFMRGYMDPTSMVWSAVRNELWLAGTDETGAGGLVRAPLDSGLASTAVPEQRIALPAGAGEARLSFAAPLPSRAQDAIDQPMILVGAAGGVFRVLMTQDRISTVPWIAPAALGGVIDSAVSDSSEGGLYVAVASEGQSAPVTSRIIRLRRQ